MTGGTCTVRKGPEKVNMTFKTIFEPFPGAGGPSVYVLLLLINE